MKASDSVFRLASLQRERKTVNSCQRVFGPNGLVGLGDVIEGPVFFSWRKLPRCIELLCVTEYLRRQVFGFLSARKGWRAGADKEHP
jgi:hypothetical protein